MNNSAFSFVCIVKRSYKQISDTISCKERLQVVKKIDATSVEDAISMCADFRLGYERGNSFFDVHCPHLR